MAYQLHNSEPGAIAFHTGGFGSEEMIRIAPDGFYVRGVRVPADEQEAQAVYDAFKAWMAWASLQRN